MSQNVCVFRPAAHSESVRVFGMSDLFDENCSLFKPSSYQIFLKCYSEGSAHLNTVATQNRIAVFKVLRSGIFASLPHTKKMFLKLANGNRVNVAAALYIREYNDPALGRVYRLHFTEQEIITVSDAGDVEKVKQALNDIERGTQKSRADPKHMSLEEVLDRLYDSEINFSISCFWDNGIAVKLGDETNGSAAEHNVRTAAEAATWLDETARCVYPRSKYATGRDPIGAEGNGIQ